MSRSFFFFRSVSSGFSISLKNPETLLPRFYSIISRAVSQSFNHIIGFSRLNNNRIRRYDVSKSVRSRNNQRPTHDVTRTMIPGILSVRLLALVTGDARRIQDHKVTSNIVTARLSVFVGQGIAAGAGFKTVQDRPWLSQILWGSSTCDAYHTWRVPRSCRVFVRQKCKGYDRGHHDYLLVSNLCTKDRRPAVPRNSSRGGDHVLRGAHKRNCACAPCLSLTPTHVTERREALPSLFSPSFLSLWSLCARELYTRRWIRHKTPSESTVTTLRVTSV